MKFLVSLFISVAPALWKTMTTSTKIFATVIAIVAITLYTILVSWAAIKATTLDAYDARWDIKYEKAHSENDKMLRQFGADVGEMKTSIKNIEHIMMQAGANRMTEPRKHNP